MNQKKYYTKNKNNNLTRPATSSDGNLIYSLWKGYLKKKDTKDFIDYLKSRIFDVHEIHTSGHANVDKLKAMDGAIKPILLIPIHTFEPDKYKLTFNVPVKELEDGVRFIIL